MDNQKGDFVLLKQTKTHKHKVIVVVALLVSQLQH